MIFTKAQLHEYLLNDIRRYDNKPTFLDRILHNEKWYIWQYICSLRHVEYYINKNQKNSVFFYYLWYRYKYYSFKTHITIYPNTCEAGLYIPHIGDMIWIKASARLGQYCTLRPGVVIGKKDHEKAIDMPVRVGDNVNFGLGVRVFGKITIGTNVTIGANSVVTKDIPDNAVVGGVPAEIIKIKKYD